MALTEESKNKSFAGYQYVYSHQAKTTNCAMRVGVYLPPQAFQDEDASVPALLWLSGLTCTEQNFITKAGAQKMAAELGLAIICPDTSPRGASVADDDAYDLGQGAGFYIDATQSPWSEHFQMESYLIDELMPLLDQELPLNGQWSISGHSMGGHGALTLYLKYPARFAACSAFAPIVNPSAVPWGIKAFATYLGEDQSAWQAHDAKALIQSGRATQTEILIDQGRDDNFLETQLQPEHFVDACRQAGQPVNLRVQSGYDHSYYFISSFIDEHLLFHVQHLSEDS